jgi:predicted transglutaminase-like cysteine proteinase
MCFLGVVGLLAIEISKSKQNPVITEAVKVVVEEGSAKAVASISDAKYKFPDVKRPSIAQPPEPKKPKVHFTSVNHRVDPIPDADLITEEDMKDFLDQFSEEMTELQELWKIEKEDFYRTQLQLTDEQMKQIHQVNDSYDRRYKLVTDRLATAQSQIERDSMIRHIVSMDELYAIEVESVIGIQAIDRFIGFREEFNKKSRNQQTTDAAVTGF